MYVTDVQKNAAMQSSSVLTLTNEVNETGSGRGWLDELCFRPLFGTIEAELGWGQPGGVVEGGCGLVSTCLFSAICLKIVVLRLQSPALEDPSLRT